MRGKLPLPAAARRYAESFALALCMCTKPSVKLNIEKSNKSFNTNSNETTSLNFALLFLFIHAGVSIEQLCEIAFTDPLGYPPAEKDRLSMVRAARVLLQNVTRVLLLADIVVVKQLMVSKDKVYIAEACSANGHRSLTS